MSAARIPLLALPKQDTMERARRVQEHQATARDDMAAALARLELGQSKGVGREVRRVLASGYDILLRRTLLCLLRAHQELLAVMDELGVDTSSLGLCERCRGLGVTTEEVGRRARLRVRLRVCAACHGGCIDPREGYVGAPALAAVKAVCTPTQLQELATIHQELDQVFRFGQTSCQSSMSAVREGPRPVGDLGVQMSLHDHAERSLLPARTRRAR